MDFATIVGTTLGFVVIAWAILMGGSWTIFVDYPSMAITIGGMLCATMIHFSLPQFLGIFSVIKKTIVTKIPSQPELIQRMVNCAAISRRDGVLALEQEIGRLDNHFFIKALQMVVDGRNGEQIRELLWLEIQYLQDRHANGKKILEFMGSSAPAFGMIGTLIGLVQMLRSMTSPEAIGAGMAVALITTFYGAMASNLIFIPFAGKLGLYSKAETIAMEMIIEGVCAIAEGGSPMAIRDRLHAFVSHKHREEVKATV
jgi:chemotaxis protein MotA